MKPSFLLTILATAHVIGAALLLPHALTYVAAVLSVAAAVAHAFEV